MGTPCENLKRLQQAIRLQEGRKPPITDLLVLARQNDPFYAGTETAREQAQWFAELWEHFGYVSGVHLRRIHYRILASGDIRKADGKPYENDANSWKYMQAASRQARYLGLIDPEAIVDKRNPDPQLYLTPPEPWEETTPGWSYEFEGRQLPGLDPHQLSDALDALTAPELYATGYGYRETMQPYHVELWVEKTTMDDILLPIARRTATNYVSGAGYQSITAMVSLLRERVARLEKPCRVLYISDFDAAGKNMPRQMARQMQFWIDQYAADCDIRVEPIALTAEQARHYPKAPDSGAVELDAMEALEPGRLARIVRESVGQFRDERLSLKAHDAALNAQDALNEEFESACTDELTELEAIKAEAEEIYERYRSRLEELAVSLDADLAPLQQRLETVQQSHTRFSRLPRARVAAPAGAGGRAG